MSEINNRTAYIDQLTLLRGIAAFFVIVSHSLRATEVTYSVNDEAGSLLLISLLDLGTFGVVLFFVLSGCTLHISGSKGVGYRYIQSFYIKRVVRIWPAFLLSILIYSLFGLIFSYLYVQPQGHWIEKQFLSIYSVNDVISYLTLTFNVTGPSGLFNNAYWSLPVEFQYYLIFPIIVASIKYIGFTGPILIGVLLFLLPKLGFVDFEQNSVFTLAYSFCGGVLIGHIYKSYSFCINRGFGLGIVLALFILVSAINNSYISLPDIPIVSDKIHWYVAAAITSVFVALFTKANTNNCIGLFLKQYGTISYSSYLYHNLFVAIAVLIIIRFEIYDGEFRLLFTLFFTLITSYIAACLSYKYIEKPSVDLGRKLIKAK